MENESWKNKLTPFDAELAIMVESAFGKPCELKNGGDSYFFEADYEKHKDNPEYLLAVWDAIEGRLGDRVLEMKDDPERHAFFVRAKFSEAIYPGIIRMDRESAPQDSYGTTYYNKLVEIRAIQIERENYDAVLKFVGNGEWEIEKCPGGKATFHFRNAAGSVYAHAPEHSYIVHVGPEQFEIVDKETFEKEYELR